MFFLFSDALQKICEKIFKVGGGGELYLRAERRAGDH